MKKILISIFNLMVLSIFSMNLFAQTEMELPIWDEQFSDNPLIKVYLPAKSNGQAIVCCPGGGYSYLSMDYEGTLFAPWLNEQGIALIVLKYRMPNGNPDIPLSDAKQAMRIVRKNADDWQIDSEKVGIMGFSAGGHLASTLATHFDDGTRPDFQILFYPVVTMDAAYTHSGSRSNLLGSNPSSQLVQLYSNELQVTARTPQAFILHSNDDNVVPSINSINYYLALQRNKVSAEMHIYPTGSHGWGFSDNYTYKPQWTASLKKWLEIQNSNSPIKLSEFDYTDKKIGLVSTLPQGINLSALTDNNARTGITADYEANTSFSVELESSMVVTGYSLTVKNTDSKNNPKSWTLQGSTDGKRWQTLDSKDNQTFLPSESKLIDIEASSVSSFLFKYVRLVISANSGGSKLHIADWQIFGHPNNFKESVTSNGGTTTAQYAGVNQNGWIETIDKLTDGKFNTKYCVVGQAGGWMQYESTTPVTVKRYAITSSEKSLDGRDPKDWKLSGSNDGTKWDVLDSRTNQNFMATNSTMEYTISEPKEYKIYRLEILENKGEGADLQLSEWMLFEQSGSSITANSLNSSISIVKRKIQVSSEESGSYELFNSNGIIAKKGLITSGDNLIEMSSDGVFFLHISSTKGSKTEKLIITN